MNELQATKEKAFYNSRYIIKYHPKSSRYSCYLSGATHENRQDTYTQLSKYLQFLKDNGKLRFNVNHHIWQDIEDVGALQIVPVEDQHGLIRLIAQPTSKFKSEFREFFAKKTMIDLGCIPSDSEFASDIKDYYTHLYKKDKDNVFNISSLKFNAWDNNIILLGVSIKTFKTKNTVTPIQYKKVKIEMPVRRLVVARPKVQEVLNTLPGYETYDEVMNYIYGQFSASYMIYKG